MSQVPIFQSISRLMQKVFGSSNERAVRKYRQNVELINRLEPEISALSDRHLAGKTVEFRQRMDSGESIDDLLPEAFACVREASRRITGMRHYDVQLIGGMVLHEGSIAEMVTGEGKTLVATLPAYLNGLVGPGVHIVTTNDYLAQRDRDWMGPIFEFLGLTCGAIHSDMDNEERQRAYGCDITYGTNNEFGFDYLRDNMKTRVEHQVQGNLRFAIVDEVDSILIDEARTPLIISGPADRSTDKYYRADQCARFLKLEKHFEVKEKEHQVLMTEEGIIAAQEFLKVDDFYTGANMDWPHHLEQALKAHNLYKLDKEYVIDDGEIVIIDEFTGRKMAGRRWSDGLHQAVEAKEGLRVREENQTLATITLQNFFRMYSKLAGMTGTAMTEAGEFFKIYKLDVVAIPTNRPMRRQEYNDVIYQSEREKYTAIIDEILELNEAGRPILIGTTSVEKSEFLSGVLRRRGIDHEVLNAKNHAREAEIIAQAGRKRAVVVSTNMAGRGTDILLGGNPEVVAHRELRKRGLEDGTPEYREEFRVELEKMRKLLAAEHEEVVALGGLHVIGTERHEARRIDNQLRGRCGRQGDPGSSRFFLSLEDDLMRKFAGPKVRALLGRLGLRDGEAIEHPWVTRSIGRAQKRVEDHNFEIRKNLLEYDEVNNEQRKLIYGMRQEVLEGDGLREKMERLIDQSIENALNKFLPEKTPKDECDLEGLARWFNLKLGDDVLTSADIDELGPAGTEDRMKELTRERYDQRESQVGPEMMREVERFLLLQTIDSKWKDHLYTMDYLRSGIGMQGWLAQRDPKVMYKRYAYEAFADMLAHVAEDSTDFLYRLRIRAEDEERLEQKWEGGVARHDSTSAYEQQQAQAVAGSGGAGGKPKPIKRDEPKVGRNEACPCGSGRKYKRCCGLGG